MLFTLGKLQCGGKKAKYPKRIVIFENYIVKVKFWNPKHLFFTIFMVYLKLWSLEAGGLFYDNFSLVAPYNKDVNKYQSEIPMKW